MNSPSAAGAARCIEIIARAVVLRDGQILAAQERGDTGYHLPGGHVETGEAVEHGLLRELREELGSDAAVIRFMGVVEYRYTVGGAGHHELNLVFEVDLTSATPSSQEEHLEFSWLPLKELPGIELRPEPLKAAVFRWLRDQSVFWRPMSR